MRNPGKVVNTLIQSFLFLSVWGLILLEVFYKLLCEYFSEPGEFLHKPFLYLCYLGKAHDPVTAVNHWGCSWRQRQCSCKDTLSSATLEMFSMGILSTRFPLLLPRVRDTPLSFPNCFVPCLVRTYHVQRSVHIRLWWGDSWASHSLRDQS